MNYIYTKHDILDYFPIDYFPRYKPERFLMLHPSLIEDELEKVDMHNMIYTAKYPYSRENTLFFASKMPIQWATWTHDILELIPREVILPIGGLKGRYYIKLDTIDDEGQRCYSVYDKRFNRRVIKEIPIGEIYYLDNDYAVLDRFVIMRNGMVHRPIKPSYCSFDYNKKKGCLLVRYKTVPSGSLDCRPFDLYDLNGNLIQASYDQREIDEIIESLPDVTPPQLPTQRNTQIFRDMIATKLRRHCKVIPDCDSDDLVDIAKYLSENDLGLIVELDTMQVYKVDFAKYFRKLGIDDGTQNTSSGPKHIMRPVLQNSKEKH